MNKYRICLKSFHDYAYIYISGDNLQLDLLQSDSCMPDPTIVKLQGTDITIEFETHDVSVEKEKE